MPQDQDDIKGADAMKQAPTPGPLDMDAAVRALHEALGGNGWAYSNYGGDELNSERPELEAGVRAVLSLAPTAPVEASGSERWPVGSWLSAALDDPKVCDAMKSDILDWFDNGGHLRPQPSGENRDEDDAIALRQARYILKDLHAKDGTCGYGKLAAVCERIADRLQGFRPAPVAPGGQHSSGEVALKPETEDLLAEFKAAKTRTAYAPVAETAGEAANRNEAKAVLGWFAGLARKEGQHVQADWLDSYIASLSRCPVPAQDDDKLRRAVEALDCLKIVLPLVRATYGPRHPVVPRIEALAALKSTAAKEGGA